MKITIRRLTNHGSTSECTSSSVYAALPALTAAHVQQIMLDDIADLHWELQNTQAGLATVEAGLQTAQIH
jgi:hypothetical protein